MRIDSSSTLVEQAGNVPAAGKDTWSENKIAGVLARQIFHRKNLVVVPNCIWTGDECDLLIVTESLRIIDVEVKISRADFRADAKKDKWLEHWTGTWHTPTKDRVRTPRDWPRRVWKHYYAMPKAIWKPEMKDQRPSNTSGVILLSEIGSRVFAHVEVRAKPCRDADKLSPADAIDIARLASLRMWDAYDKLSQAVNLPATLTEA